MEVPKSRTAHRPDISQDHEPRKIIYSPSQDFHNGKGYSNLITIRVDDVQEYRVSRQAARSHAICYRTPGGQQWSGTT